MIDFRTKIDTHVDFPLTGLEMADYLLSKQSQQPNKSNAINPHETRGNASSATTANTSSSHASSVNVGSSLYDLAAVIVHHGSG